jgi:hypothetical protein
MVTDEIEEQLGRSPEDWFHRGIGKPFLPVIVTASHTKPIVLTPAPSFTVQGRPFSAPQWGQIPGEGGSLKCF